MHQYSNNIRMLDENIQYLNIIIISVSNIQTLKYLLVHTISFNVLDEGDYFII